MKTALWVRFAALLALTAVALAGCTSTDTSAGDPAPSGSGASTDANSSAFALPVDLFGLTAEQEGTLTLATSILTGKCMRRFGYAYDAAADRAGVEAVVKSRLADFGLYGNARRYGITDPTIALKYGYHLSSPATPTPETTTRGPAHGLPPLTPAMRTILTGTAADGTVARSAGGQTIPDGGCLGEANKSLVASAKPPQSPLVGQIRSESFARSLEDPAVVAVFRAWSECMAGKGYPYKEPLEAGNDLPTGGPTPTARELAVAQADVACKQQTNVVSVWVDFEISYQNAQIDKHAQELKQAKDDRDALLAAVAGVIAEGA